MVTNTQTHVTMMMMMMIITRGQSNLTKSDSRGAHSPGVGFPISAP